MQSIFAPLAIVRRLWPLTLPGMLLAAGGWLAYSYYGLDEQDFILYAACWLALIVAAACLALTFAGTLRMVLWASAHTRGRPIERTGHVGTPFETGFRCLALRWWPLVQVRLEWVTPEDVEVETDKDGPWITELVTPRGRGRHGEITRRITVRDLLGLTAISFDITRPASLRIAPAAGGADLATILRQASGEALPHPEGEPEGEYIEMRRYQPGDPVRMILWKAYARSRRLLVRVPERATSPMPSAVAALVAGPEDEPAASVARMFLEHGLLGTDFVFSTDGAKRPMSTASEALDAIIDSAHHREQGGAGLEQLLTELPPAQLARCLIFAPGAPGPWLNRVAAFIKRLPAAPTLVLAMDEIPHEPPRSVGARVRGRVHRWLVAEPEARREKARKLAGLPPVYAGLEAAGARVILLHRPSGRAVAGSQLDALKINPGAATAAAAGA